MTLEDLAELDIGGMLVPDSLTSVGVPMGSSDALCKTALWLPGICLVETALHVTDPLLITQGCVQTMTFQGPGVLPHSTRQTLHEGRDYSYHVHNSIPNDKQIV